MFTIDTNKPVLVTGATGYVAGWIVKGLLEAGATVHATVRNPDRCRQAVSSQCNRRAKRRLDQVFQGRSAG